MTEISDDTSADSLTWEQATAGRPPGDGLTWEQATGGLSAWERRLKDQILPSVPGRAANPAALNAYTQRRLEENARSLARQYEGVRATHVDSPDPSVRGPAMTSALREFVGNIPEDARPGMMNALKAEYEKGGAANEVMGEFLKKRHDLALGYRQQIKDKNPTWDDTKVRDATIAQLQAEGYEPLKERASLPALPLTGNTSYTKGLSELRSLGVGTLEGSYDILAAGAKWGTAIDEALSSQEVGVDPYGDRWIGRKLGAKTSADQSGPAKQRLAMEALRARVMSSRVMSSDPVPYMWGVDMPRIMGNTLPQMALSTGAVAKAAGTIIAPAVTASTTAKASAVALNFFMEGAGAMDQIREDAKRRGWDDRDTAVAVLGGAALYGAMSAATENAGWLSFIEKKMKGGVARRVLAGILTESLTEAAQSIEQSAIRYGIKVRKADWDTLATDAKDAGISALAGALMGGGAAAILAQSRKPYGSTGPTAAGPLPLPPSSPVAPVQTPGTPVTQAPVAPVPTAPTPTADDGTDMISEGADPVAATAQMRAAQNPLPADTTLTAPTTPADLTVNGVVPPDGGPGLSVNAAGGIDVTNVDTVYETARQLLAAGEKVHGRENIRPHEEFLPPDATPAELEETQHAAQMAADARSEYGPLFDGAVDRGPQISPVGEGAQAPPARTSSAEIIQEPASTPVTPLPTLEELAQNERNVAKHLGRAPVSRTQSLRLARKKLAAAQADARTDALTGLGNKRAYLETMARLKAESDKTGKPFSFLLGDAANLKAANTLLDYTGAGNLLKMLANDLLRGATEGRTSDVVVVRQGGDEFGVFLPNTDTEGATIVRDRILAAVGAQQIVPEFAIFLEFGIATYTPGADMEALLSHAGSEMEFRKKDAKIRLNQPTTRSEAEAKVKEIKAKRALAARTPAEQVAEMKAATASPAVAANGKPPATFMSLGGTLVSADGEFSLPDNAVMYAPGEGTVSGGYKTAMTPEAVTATVYLEPKAGEILGTQTQPRVERELGFFPTAALAQAAIDTVLSETATPPVTPILQDAIDQQAKADNTPAPERMEDVVPPDQQKKPFSKGLFDFMNDETGALSFTDLAASIGRGGGWVVQQMKGFWSFALDNSLLLRGSITGRLAVSVIDEASATARRLSGNLMFVWDQAMVGLTATQRKTAKKWMRTWRTDNQTNFMVLIEDPGRLIGENIPEGALRCLAAELVMLNVTGDAATEAGIPQTVTVRDAKGVVTGTKTIPFTKAKTPRYLRAYTQEGISLLALQDAHYLWDPFVQWFVDNPSLNPGLDVSNPENLRARLQGEGRSGKTKEAGSLEHGRTIKEMPMSLIDPRTGNRVELQLRDPFTHYSRSVHTQTKRIGLFTAVQSVLLPEYVARWMAGDFRVKGNDTLMDIDAVLDTLRKTVAREAGSSAESRIKGFNTLLENYQKTVGGSLLEEHTSPEFAAKAGKVGTTVDRVVTTTQIAMAPIFDIANALKTAGITDAVATAEGYAATMKDLLSDFQNYAAMYQSMGAVLVATVDWSVFSDTVVSDLLAKNLPHALSILGRFSEVFSQTLTARIADIWVQKVNDTPGLSTFDAEMLQRVYRLTPRQIAEIRSGQMSPETRVKVLQNAVNVVAGLPEHAHRKGWIQNNPTARFFFRFLSVVNATVRLAGALTASVGRNVQIAATSTDPVVQKQATIAAMQGGYHILLYLAAIGMGGALQKYLRRAVTGQPLVNVDDPKSWVGHLGNALVDGGIGGPITTVANAYDYSDGKLAEMPTRLVYPMAVAAEVGMALLGLGKYKDTPWSRRANELAAKQSPIYKAALRWYDRVAYPTRADYVSVRGLMKRYNETVRNIVPSSGGGDDRRYDYLAVFEAIRDGNEDGLRGALEVLSTNGHAEGKSGKEVREGLRSSLMNRRPINLPSDPRNDQHKKFLDSLSPNDRDRAIAEDHRYQLMMNRVTRPQSTKAADWYGSK